MFNDAARRLGQLATVSFCKSWDGRALCVAFIAIYFLFLHAASVLLHQPLYLVWRMLGVPAAKIPFIDLVNIPAAIQSQHAGFLPRVENPYDPLGRVFLYPHWWLYAGYTGLNLKTYIYFGIGLGILFFIAALFVLGRLSMLEGFLAGLFLISPNVMFAVERGNVDIPLFILMAAAFAVRKSLPLSSAFLFLGGLLKFYPAAGFLAHFCAPWRKNISWIMGMMILLGFCFWINYGEMAFIFRMAPHHGLGSTGTACLGLYLCDYWGWRISYNLIFFFGTFAFIAVLLLAWRFRPEIHSRFLGERELFAFRLGAGLYVGAFALGSNIDYRLIVLGFCLPFLFQLLWSPDAVQRWALWALVGILLYAYWPVATAISPRMAEFVKQLMTWSLVVCLMGLVFGTLMEPGAKKKVPLPRDPA